MEGVLKSLLPLALCVGLAAARWSSCNNTINGDAYAFNLTTIEGEHLPLEEYRGQVLVVFNSATY